MKKVKKLKKCVSEAGGQEAQNGNGNGNGATPIDEDLAWLENDYNDEGFRAAVSRFIELVRAGGPDKDVYRVAKNLMRIAKNLYNQGRLETARTYAGRSVQVLERGNAS
jgi:hypothetical protein